MYEFRVLDSSFRTYFVSYYFEINLSPSFDKKGIRALTIDKDNAPKVLSLFMCVLCFKIFQFYASIFLDFNWEWIYVENFWPCLLLRPAKMGNLGHVSACW